MVGLLVTGQDYFQGFSLEITVSVKMEFRIICQGLGMKIGLGIPIWLGLG